MASTVTLVSGANTITLNGPGSATTIQAPTRHAAGKTAAGDPLNYKYNSSTYSEWVISLDSLTAAQWVSLQNFFYTVTDGPAGTFTYTHTDGTAYPNTRFNMNTLSPRRINNNLFGVVLRLLVPQLIIS